MNKKLLFGIMSLAALAACTNDDFDSQQQVAEGTSPIQFEVINNNAAMRAHMNSNDKIVWSASDGDLFTLYHGGSLTAGALSTFQNATYKASEGEGTATLTTPSVIKAGRAIMVWPVDTIWHQDGSANLKIEIPADQKADVENYIPYASDLITIAPYADYEGTTGGKPNKNVTAGYGRTYPVYMRPMASQLILHADYAGTDATLAPLKTGDDPIDDIELTSVKLQTKAGGNTLFTQKIQLKFAAPTATQGNWTRVANNTWSEVTDFDVANVATTGVQVNELTTVCLDDDKTKWAKFLILPQAPIEGSTPNELEEAAIVVNTTYGKVVIQDPAVVGTETKYTDGTGGTPDEVSAAWYRYLGASDAAETYETKAAAATGSLGHKTTTTIAEGLKQTIDALNSYKPGTSSIVKGEPTGAAADRYVNVLLTHLDMSGLHVESDKQLRDVARVWKQMNLPSVTVYLDGGKKGDVAGEFTISQQTIAKIKEVNATGGKLFTVKPCNITTPTNEKCTRIVIEDGGNIPDLDFIVAGDAANTADVVLKAGKNWKWATNAVAAKKAVIVDATATGVAKIINEGTFASDADATLAIYNNATTPAQVFTIPFVNDGTWNISANKIINVQLDVTNYGTVNIPAGAEYRQDGTGNVFTNEATDLPSRFGGDDKEIGLVDNSGVFANINGGNINNYGLIEHRIAAAKTFITANENGGTGFGAAFADPANKIGRINLTYDNRAEDNVTVNNLAATGFVSVTVNGEVSTLSSTAGALGAYVNYIIIKKGVREIQALNAQYAYVEIADEDNTEISWTTGSTSTYTGLIVLSPVNITYGTNVSATVTYLGANMYVGGTFNKTGTNWNGYYGNTTANVATKYITFN